MPVLDPRNIDVADLLSLIRDIADRLDGIEKMLDLIDDRLIDTEGDLHGVDSKMDALIATEPGHERAILLATHAVINDMEDRRSLIPVHEDDDEYKPHCASCLLKKNGYPRLAQLLADTGEDTP
jgi:hypothetical protein